MAGTTISCSPVAHPSVRRRMALISPCETRISRARKNERISSAVKARSRTPSSRATPVMRLLATGTAPVPRPDRTTWALPGTAWTNAESSRPSCVDSAWCTSSMISTTRRSVALSARARARAASAVAAPDTLSSAVVRRRSATRAMADRSSPRSTAPRGSASQTTSVTGSSPTSCAHWQRRRVLPAPAGALTRVSVHGWFKAADSRESRAGRRTSLSIMTGMRVHGAPESRSSSSIGTPRMK